MTDSEGTAKPTDDPRSAFIDDFVNGLADSLEDGSHPQSEEASEFVKGMKAAMHEGDMTEKTAQTIAGAFALLFAVAGGNSMRKDMGFALKELMETQSQHRAVWGQAAETLLKAAVMHTLAGIR